MLVFLEDLAKKCAKYTKIDAIFYLHPELDFQSGLKRVYTDEEVRCLILLCQKYRVVQCYVVHGVNIPNVLLMLEGSPISRKRVKHVAKRKKMTPKRIQKLDFGKVMGNVGPTEFDEYNNVDSNTQNDLYNHTTSFSLSDLQPHISFVINPPITYPQLHSLLPFLKRLYSQ